MKRKVKMYKPCFNCGGSTHKYQEGGFTPHIMIDPQTGEKYEARTMNDHVEYSEMGYLHEDEMQQMAAERKAFGGMIKKTLKDAFKTGGSTAKQNANINDFARDRNNMFKTYMSNNAQRQIAEEEAMNSYDQFVQSQRMMPPQFNWGGFNRNYKANWSPDDYLTHNMQNMDLMRMYGAQDKKIKQGLGDTFGQLGNLISTIEYNPEVTTKTKTKIEKPFRKEYRQAKRDYNKDVKDWRNNLERGWAGEAMPEFNFTPGGADLTARYGKQVPYVDYMEMGGIPKFTHGGWHASEPEYWEYQADPTKTPEQQRQDVVAQDLFENVFEVVPDTWPGNADDYWALPHSEKLKYDPNAKLRDAYGKVIINPNTGKAVTGEAGLTYDPKNPPKLKTIDGNPAVVTGNQKKQVKSGSKAPTSNKPKTAGDVAEEIEDTEDTEVVEEGPRGNVNYDDEFDPNATNTTTTTTDGQGNVFIPKQSFQVGPGTYIDGVRRGIGSAPMIGYNPENTYLDYFKHRGRGFLRPDKTVMKFSHYFGPDGKPVAGTTPGDGAGATTDALDVNNAPVVEDVTLQKLNEWKKANPNATEEETRAYYDQARKQALEELKNYRPDQEFTGTMDEFLEKGDPYRLVTPEAAWNEGALYKEDDEGNQYMQYPGTNYVYKVSKDPNDESKQIFTAVDDPETLEKFQGMTIGRGSDAAYYDYDPVRGWANPRADFVPEMMQKDDSYDDGIGYITEYETDSDYGRQKEEFMRRRSGPGAAGLSRDQFDSDEAYWTELGRIRDEDKRLTLEEMQELGYNSPTNLSTYYTQKERDTKAAAERAEQRKQDVEMFGETYAAAEDKVRELEADKSTERDFYKGRGKYSGRALKDAGFSKQDRKAIRRTARKEGDVKGAFEEAKENRLDRAIDARDEALDAGIERAEIAADKAKDEALALEEQRWGGPNYFRGGSHNPMYYGGGAYYRPTYSHGGPPPHPEDVVTPGPGEAAGYVPVEGLDASQSAWQGADPGQGAEKKLTTYPGMTKWADTTQKRKLQKYGDPMVNAAKFAPAIMQGIANIGNALTAGPDKMNQLTTADYALAPDRTWRAGADAGMNAFNPVGVTPAIGSPIQYTGGAGIGKYGGQFQLGGTYSLSDNEIAQILALGGTIEYVD